MSTTASTSNSPKFTGTHMMLLMICFFGVIIIVNFTMAYLASSSWTGLVVKNTYVASQQYNEHLEAAEAQREMGLSSSVSYHQSLLVFTVTDKSGNAVEIENAILKIGRPAFEQADKVLHFMPAPNKSRKITVQLDPGIWVLEISGTVSGLPYRRDARLFVNSDKNGVLE